MIYDLQRANMWKRISAYLLDAILLGMVVVGFAFLLSGVLGYDSKIKVGAQSAQTAMNMCWLVAGLYLFSAILMFVGIAVIYNLDKKTMAVMTEELAARKSAEE